MQSSERLHSEFDRLTHNGLIFRKKRNIKKRTASLLMVFTLGSLSGCTPNVQDPAVDPGKTKAEASKVDADIFKVEWVKVEIPTEMEKKKDYSLPVTVKNASAGVWPSKGTLAKNVMGGFRVAGHVMKRAPGVHRKAV